MRCNSLYSKSDRNKSTQETTTKSFFAFCNDFELQIITYYIVVKSLINSKKYIMPSIAGASIKGGQGKQLPPPYFSRIAGAALLKP